VFQRALHPAIPTPLIDEILARAKMVGALGGKALGASGGGCVLVVARQENVDRVRGEVGSLAQLLPVQIDEGGFTWIAEE
jgi:D-glycero-alpha-D-manno-heptose-7-phosphate kinase